MKNKDTQSFQKNNNYSFRPKSEHAETITCPKCGKTVKLISFGYGWVGVCCNSVVYNSDKLPGH
ncbi:MAG TPA: hypothetical protein PK966_04990 [Syntrophorhabdaceae bacterium]|nr:hypothetical protein [Syntrophorhabdaceae bacterium]